MILKKFSVQTALITSYVSYKVLPTFSIFKKYTSLVPIWIKIAFFRPSQKPRIFAKISLRIFASSLRLKTSQNWPLVATWFWHLHSPLDDNSAIFSQLEVGLLSENVREISSDLSNPIFSPERSGYLDYP